jgi:hypothetical protein
MFYKEFYGLELTKEQVKQILNPQSNVGRWALGVSIGIAKKQ